MSWQVSSYLAAIAAIGRSLFEGLNSRNEIVLRVAIEILGAKSDSPLRDFPILNLLSNIYSFQKQKGSKSLRKAAESWIEQDGVDVNLKAEFLMMKIGSSKGEFSIPEKKFSNGRQKWRKNF